MSDSVSMTPQQYQQAMQAEQNQMMGNSFAMYKQSAETSFQQSMAQTMGQLALDAAKAKPQV